jgi:MFS family permease
MILNGICILGLAFSDCNIFLAVFFLTLSLALQGAVSTGALSSMVDIAPNYAGITLGIVSTISIMTGFVSPIMVGYITFGNQSVQAWKKIFEISAGMTLSCGIIYMIFNDTSVQPWNRGYTKVNMENQQVALYEIGEKVEKVKEENDSKDHIEINKLNTVQNN